MRAAGTMRAAVVRLVVTALLGMALPAGAASTAELLRCQKGLHVRAAIFAKLVQGVLSSCALRVETCQLAQEIDGEDPTKCLLSASAACASYSAKIPTYKSAAGSKVVVPCNLVPVDDLEQYVAGLGFHGVNSSCGATTVSGLLACLFDAVQCASERTVFVLDPRAGDALATAGIAAAHPCVQ